MVRVAQLCSDTVVLISGGELHFLCEDSAKVKFPCPIDLLFIDTFHVYGHLK
jgi:hypothetical protein